MKAAVYHGVKDIRCVEIPDPVLKDDHAMLVKVTVTSICGSDLHVYRGALDATMEKGQSQTGHELVGEVMQVGKAVGRFKAGDRVAMAYSLSCGDCYCCRVGQTAHCETTQKAVYGFGNAFGAINGTHAEAMIVPHADAHAIKIPASIPDAPALTLSCNLPTALIANRLAAIQPGEFCAVVGYGPCGMMATDLALMGGGLSTLVVLDRVPHRLEFARKRGAIAIDVSQEGWKARALAETGGRGFDKVIEMVGLPEALQMCLDIVRPGGTVTAMGVFTDDTFNLNLADVFLRNITLHMNGFASVQPYMWDAVRLLENGVVDASSYFSHEFKLDDVDRAFSTFYEKRNGVNKVLIRA